MIKELLAKKRTRSRLRALFMCEMEAEVKVTNLLPFSGRLYFAEATGEAIAPDAAFAFFTLCCALAGLAEAGAAAEAEATAAEAEATGAEAAF